ncbi:MAG: sugar phosphate isomerase/epimerase family protein [Intestinibacter sp.]
MSALPFNLEEALNICEKNRKIEHIEVGLDNIENVDVLKKYKDKIENLNLSVSIHLPMELNTCENIKYIRNSWIDFICKIDEVLTQDFDIKYYNLHLGYAMTNRLNRNRQKYLKNTVEFLNDSKLNQKVLSIENTYSKKGDFSNVGDNVDDFNYIFNNIINKRVYFCYDTGHDLISKGDYTDVFEMTKIIHFSDNDGVNDLHVGYKKGILTDEIFDKIEKINPDYLILEINFDDIEDTLNYF